jgi:hypothetical protein
MHIAIFPYIKEVGADWISQNDQKQALNKLQTFRDFGDYTDIQWFQNMERFAYNLRCYSWKRLSCGSQIRAN